MYRFVANGNGPGRVWRLSRNHGQGDGNVFTAEGAKDAKEGKPKKGLPRNNADERGLGSLREFFCVGPHSKRYTFGLHFVASCFL